MEHNIEKVIIYIAQHFSNSLKVETLAAQANLSLFHFHRLFKQKTGMTPQKYLEKIRLENAAHTLALQPTIKKIHLAFENGFNSPASFNRSFKQYFGQSPSQMVKNSTITTINKQNKASLDLEKYQQIDIRFSPTYYLKTSLIHPTISEIEHHLKTKTFDTSRPVFGIFVDAPFHLPLNECRYLIGQMVTQKKNANFQINSGFYTRILVQGNMTLIKEAILAHYEVLCQHDYQIKKPLGVEKFIIPNSNKSIDFSKISRELYIPICK